MRADAPLETLFLPFMSGHLAWTAGEVLFLRARAGVPLQQHMRAGLLCEQTFKPDAEALKRAGYRLATADQARAEHAYPLVLVLPPRQRDEARATLARAVAAASAGGRVVACADNNEGARSHEADLARLAGPVETLSKKKCRVFWTPPLDGPRDAKLFEEWRALDAVRPIAANRFLSRPGVFAWDRIDVASALLAAHLPTDLSGRAADLGAGFGYLSVELLMRCPGIVALDVYEAEARALDLARENLRSLASDKVIGFHWHDVTEGLPHRYDVIVTNPPFHTGSREDRPDIGRRFIQAAADALNPDGRLWLVANRHLPYESVLNERFGTARIVVQAQGYKIVEARRSS